MKTKIKTGKKLIAEERAKVLKRISKEDDIIANQLEQLSKAARWLSLDLISDPFIISLTKPPKGWDKDLWKKMCSKPYQERLVIAGQLYLAEADRCKAMADKIAKQLDIMMLQLTIK